MSIKIYLKIKISCFNPNYKLEHDNLEIVKDVFFNQNRNYDMFDSNNYLS